MDLNQTLGKTEDGQRRQQIHEIAEKFNRDMNIQLMTAKVDAREKLLAAIAEAGSDLQFVARKLKQHVPDWKSDGELKALSDTMITLLNAGEEIARLASQNAGLRDLNKELLVGIDYDAKLLTEARAQIEQLQQPMTRAQETR